ncbi:DUF3822 family protein [Flavobacterium caeni]|uniref:DUF3822 domain-containing protein n=1 Tax=Flavobacterium caeni TaxID=490189 RepID=A0A1G5CVM8_9FLAO|nr:DUF3822 family protein [Flavobacterium caeni]SCY06367.1 Protein of unknown function [Flavobacterium caeni]
MLVHNPNITEKVYRKLTLMVAPEGLSFCVSDTLNQRVLSFRDIVFDQANAPVEQSYGAALRNHHELNEKYDEILILHNSNLSGFVPTALFDEHFLGSYLQYDTKVFETDFFTYDELPAYHMNNVYIPFGDINNFLVDHFSEFTARHAHTVLVSKLLEASKNVDEKKMFVHFRPSHFEVVVVQNQNLLLFNSFEYRTPEDFIYYILFTAEQLNLNPEHFKLELLGDIAKDDAFYTIAYTYIRNVALFDTGYMQLFNAFTATENRKHFILFHS